MNTTSATLVEPGAPAAVTALSPRWMMAAAAAVVAALAGLSWLGGAWGALAVILAAGVALAVARQPGRVPTPAAQPAAAGGPALPYGARVGTEVMVAQVVPVWSRQMEVTRDLAATGLNKLLENFTGMSGGLDELVRQLETFSPTAAPGACDEAVEAQSPALQALLAPSARAFAQRDELLALLTRCQQDLMELQHQAKQAREIARHTRLVAFNASIEAHRSQAHGSGSQAVANELRDLAARMAATGEAVDKLAGGLAEGIGSTSRDAQSHDTTADELALELRIRAREALHAMLGAVGTTLSSTRAIREVSDALRTQLESSFVEFQFGDRVSQMLSIVGNDMTNFAAWVARHPQATQSDAAEWLQALEQSYTMEEQRAHHHGNAHVDRGSEVEFF